MFGSVLFLPWWITIIFAIGFLFMFNAYEIMLWGILADLLYGAPVESFYKIQFLFTIGFMLFFVASYFLKKKLMFYDI